MGSASKSGGEAVEMELDQTGQSIQLEEEPKKEKGREKAVSVEMLTLGSASSSSLSSAAAETKIEELEASIKNKMTLKDGPIKTELISKLEDARVQSSEEQRLARKAAWIEQARKEVTSRRSFRNSSLSDVPELAWKGILGKLADPKEKAVMSRMSLLWRDLLKTERTTFLFEMVFQLLHPLLAPNHSDIYNLRGVSQQWKGSLESYLQNGLTFNTKRSWEGIAEVNNTPPFNDSLCVVFREGDPREVHHFSEQISRTYGDPPRTSSDKMNPFVFRKLSLGVPYSIEGDAQRLARDEYWTEVFALLRQWGKHLWMIQIVLDKDTDVSENYDRLRGLLRMLPNLRFLSLGGEGYSFDNNEPQIKMMFPKACYSALEQRMAENPLPELPLLETFVVKEAPLPFITGILSKYSSTLETVTVGEVIGTLNNAGWLDTANLPRLKLLAHSTELSSLGPWAPQQPEPKFAVEQWPSLEETTLLYGNLKAAEIPGLFRCLSGFGGTLRVLTLELKKEGGKMAKLSEEALKMLSLELPHLEELSLLVCRINLKTMDFILPMSSLKKLTVVYEKIVSNFGKKSTEDKPEPSKSLAGNTNDDAAEITSREILKFGEYINRLYESNIWKLFPELKKVIIGVIARLKEGRIPVYYFDEEAKTNVTMEIKKKVYTREGYKEYCSGCSI